MVAVKVGEPTGHNFGRVLHSADQCSLAYSVETLGACRHAELSSQRQHGLPRREDGKFLSDHAVRVVWRSKLSVMMIDRRRRLRLMYGTPAVETAYSGHTIQVMMTILRMDSFCSLAVAGQGLQARMTL